MLLSFIANCIDAQVKIGNNPTVININSLLELESTSKGLLLPRLNNSQITGMVNPPKGMLVFNTTDSSLYIRRDASWVIVTGGNPSVWEINGNNIYNTNTDYIGIGTSNPGCKLDLRNVPIGFSSANKRWEIAYDSANAYFYIDEYGSARRFVIQDGGYVGIGTTQPYFDLHIHNSNTTAAIKFTNSISGNTPLDGADMGEFGNNFAINNWENGSIFFNTNHLQRVTIDPSGNLGIGTNSPSAKLDVKGSVLIKDSVGIGTTTPAARLDVKGNVKIVDGTQGLGKVLTSDSNGNASWQVAVGGQVAFFSRLKINNGFTFSGGGFNRIPFDSVFFNNGNGYDTTTHIFTAPSAGLYQFYLNVQWASSWTGVAGVGIRKLSPPSFIQNAFSNNLNSAQTEGTPALFYLNVGDQVDFWASEGGSSSVTIGTYEATCVYGYKVY